MKNLIWTYNIDTAGSEGKFVVPGTLEEVANGFQKAQILLKEGKVSGLKYSHKENPLIDPLPYDEPVLIAFCDDKQKLHAFSYLKELGLQSLGWRSHERTREDWDYLGLMRARSIGQREKLREEIGFKGHNLYRGEIPLSADLSFVGQVEFDYSSQIMMCNINGEFLERGQPANPPLPYSAIDIPVSTDDIFLILSPLYSHLTSRSIEERLRLSEEYRPLSD